MFRERGAFACALEALARRDFSAAESEFCELLAGMKLSSADRAFLLNKRGVARIGLEQRELARADFNGALAARPGFAPALTNLGNLLLEDGEIEEAIALYERAIRGDPEYAIAHLNLGVAYKRAGRIGESVRALRLAQRIERRASAASFWRRVPRR